MHRCIEVGVRDHITNFGPDNRARTDDIVANGGSAWNNVNLTFGSGGYSFPEPGLYRVVARFAYVVDRQRATTYFAVAEAEPFELRVLPPANRLQETMADSLFDPRVGHFLALGGGDDATADRLHDLLDRSEKTRRSRADAQVAYTRRALAIHLQAAYVVGSERGWHARTPDIEQALKVLSAASKAEAKSFDEYTAASTQRLMERLHQLAKG